MRPETGLYIAIVKVISVARLPPATSRRIENLTAILLFQVPLSLSLYDCHDITADCFIVAERSSFSLYCYSCLYSRA